MEINKSKRRWLPLAALLCGAGLAVGGCRMYVSEGVVVGPAYGEVVYVDQAPPPPRYEIITVSPGPEFIWIDGWWVWEGGWVWRSGHWAHRPHPGAVWERGHWEHDNHGWAHHGGHWH